jgi:hypothetical protein
MHAFSQRQGNQRNSTSIPFRHVSQNVAKRSTWWRSARSECFSSYIYKSLFTVKDSSKKDKEISLVNKKQNTVQFNKNIKNSLTMRAYQKRHNKLYLHNTDKKILSML